ncbi:hypothetical protein HPB48_018178 [Haemaphysalis longicornis]|uniref:Ionotropic receptor n=1 Tax=Haemaphysalis longicornis TaxID=44386 RepID=A0A9J6FP96_HAELO|nr:hypothetical protein HPB48_018178 [Haemaphysalis longicornis]
MIFILLILCGSFNTSDATINPLVLDIMANLDTQEFVAIAAFENSTKLLAPHFSELPKPVWLWTRFQQKSFRLLDAVFEQERRLSKVFIFLPWLLNVPREFPVVVDNIAGVAVQTHWVVSTDKDMSLNWIPKLRVGACQVVSVTPTHIEEPVNGFADCVLSRRNISSASEVFRNWEADAKKYPRNITVRIVRPNKYIVAVPEVAALMEAYAALNTTLIPLYTPVGFPSSFLILDRRADIDMNPKPFFKERTHNLYFYAMYPPCHMCFFTRLVAGQRSSLPRDSDDLITFIFSFLLLALAIVIVSHRLHRRGHFARFSAIVLFLASTFLGRSPQTLLSAGSTLKTLLALWMVGTFIVGSYLQAHITADITAVSFNLEVEDLEAFEELLDAGKLLPCVDYRFMVYALPHFQTPFLKKLASVISTRSNDCVNVRGENECCLRVHQGGHAYVRPCCSNDVFVAFQQGLRKGRGSLQMFHRAVTMLPKLPQRRQHRRLLLAISEYGLDFVHKIKTAPVSFDEENPLVPHPFSNYMSVFAIGCISAILALCCEVISFCMCRNSRLESWR